LPESEFAEVQQVQQKGVVVVKNQEHLRMNLPQQTDAYYAVHMYTQRLMLLLIAPASFKLQCSAQCACGDLALQLTATHANRPTHTVVSNVLSCQLGTQCQC
jgi:hypothetical protein